MKNSRVTDEELAKLKEMKRALYHECLVLMRKYDNDVPMHVVVTGFNLSKDPQIQEFLDRISCTAPQ